MKSVEKYQLVQHLNPVRTTAIEVAHTARGASSANRSDDQISIQK